MLTLQLALVLVTLTCLDAMAEAADLPDGKREYVEIRGVYGGVPTQWFDQGQTLDDYGVNAVFLGSGSLTPEGIARLKGQGARVFAEFNTMHEAGYLKEHPDAAPVGADGQVCPPPDGWQGVCPTHPGYRQYRMDAFRKVLQDYEIDGVWLDYHHSHASWEQAVPNMPDTCFCDRCLAQFERETGIDLPEKPTAELSALLGNGRRAFRILLGNGTASVPYRHRGNGTASVPYRHWERWVQWRCDVFTDWVREFRAILDEVRPGALLGTFHCPWTDTDFDGARLNKLAIDLKAQAKYLNVFSIMPYHARFGHPTDPAWISRQTAWLGQYLGVEGKPGERHKIWPIVQLSDWGEEVPASQVQEVLDHGTRRPATGVMVFAWGSLHAQTEKVGEMGWFYRAIRGLRFRDLPEAVRAQVSPVVPRSAAEIAGSPFGTHTTSLGEGHESGRLGDYVQEIADAGYKWVKDYFAAGDVAAGEDWRTKWTSFPPHYEEFLRAATERGLKVLLRLDYPRWHGQEPTTPEGLEAVGHFYRQAVRSFQGWVHDWEIDNEPNIGNENPRLAPEDYARIVQAAAQAIHAEDPQARVYAPATAMLQCLHDWPFPYIPRLLEAGLLDHIDVFSFHPYRQPYLRANVPEHASEFHPWQVWGSYRRQIEDLRERLRAKSGRDVPLAATEVGYPTPRDRQTEAQEISLATQAKYEQRLMIQDFALGVRPRIQFIFKRPWSDPYELEHQFNLVNADGTKRPAYFAVQNVCAVFDDTLQPANVRVDCEAPPQANAQVVAFVREHAEFEELVVAVWAGVPAEDESDGRETCRLVIHSDRYRAPVAFDLLQPTPIAARELPCQAAGPQVAVEEVPLRDAPVVVKAFAL